VKFSDVAPVIAFGTSNSQTVVDECAGRSPPQVQQLIEGHGSEDVYIALLDPLYLQNIKPVSHSLPVTST
jgi:hypothetical protein